MRTFGMTTKLDDLALLHAQHLLELPAQPHQHFFTLLRGTALAAGGISVAAPWHRFPDRLGPEPDAIETLAHVDHYAHDLAVRRGGFERLADSREHHVEPEVVDRGGAFIFELWGKRGGLVEGILFGDGVRRRWEGEGECIETGYK